MNENKRLTQLFAVLIFDSDIEIEKGTRYLSIGQRICINQERANLMKDFPDEDFIQSPIVNEKVTFILQQIRNNNLSQAYLEQARTLINN